MDKDDSGTVDITEFREFVGDILLTIYQVLDQNGDYNLQAIPEGKTFDNIPFTFFDAALIITFNFFDFSKDGILSFEEDYFKDDYLDDYLDINKDGKVAFGEILSPPTTWPAPLYKLKNLIDANKDEVLSLTEAKEFLKRTFSVLDGDKNCKLSIDEIVNIAVSIGITPSKAIAIKVLYQQFSVTLNHFVMQLILKAGQSNNLGGHLHTCTWDDIASISDWDWADSMALAVSSLLYPNFGPIYYLQDVNLFDSMSNSKTRQEHIAMLLNVLQNLLDSPEYASDILNNCDDFIPDPNIFRN